MKGGRHGSKEKKRDLRAVRDSFACGPTSKEHGQGVSKLRQTVSKTVRAGYESNSTIPKDESAAEFQVAATEES